MLIVKLDTSTKLCVKFFGKWKENDIKPLHIVLMKVYCDTRKLSMKLTIINPQTEGNFSTNIAYNKFTLQAMIILKLEDYALKSFIS